VHTPTREQFNSIIEPLKAYQHKLPEDVDMLDPRIYHACNTPMCFAGNWSIASGNGTGFTDSMELIASELGFSSSDDLTVWAHDNPSKWGNNHGNSMFSSKFAYLTEFNDKDLTTAKLIAWWEGVRDRCHPQLPEPIISDWNEYLNALPNRLEATA